MRVRPRLLRRFRSPRVTSYRSMDAGAPHVRLLSERLLPDDTWIKNLAEPQAEARVPFGAAFDTRAIDAVDDLEDPLPDGDDANDDVVVELRRSHSLSTDLETAPFEGEPVTTVDAMEVAGARNLPARSLERLVFEVALRNEIVAQRVERIEHRLDELADQLFEAATQSDLIEVEARRARLAAEVTRLSVELRAEIDSGLTRLAREMAERVAERGEVDVAPLPPISPLVSLSDLADLDTLPGDVLGRPGPFATSAG